MEHPLGPCYFSILISEIAFLWAFKTKRTNFVRLEVRTNSVRASDEYRTKPYTAANVRLFFGRTLENQSCSSGQAAQQKAIHGHNAFYGKVYAIGVKRRRDGNSGPTTGPLHCFLYASLNSRMERVSVCLFKLRHFPRELSHDCFKSSDPAVHNFKVISIR